MKTKRRKRRTSVPVLGSGDGPSDAVDFASRRWPLKNAPFRECLAAGRHQVPLGHCRAGEVYETRLRIKVYETGKGDEFRKLETSCFPGPEQTRFWGQWGSANSARPVLISSFNTVHVKEQNPDKGGTIGTPPLSPKSCFYLMRKGICLVVPLRAWKRSKYLPGSRIKAVRSCGVRNSMISAATATRESSSFR